MTITRRDFVAGFAVSTAGLAMVPAQAISAGLLAPHALPSARSAPPYYPPALTGLRGSHAGAFEAAHRLAFAGQTADVASANSSGVHHGTRTEAGTDIAIPQAQTDATYDLVIVGGGLSGLAAAWFYHQQAQGQRTVLILENHDDFGGHAKRNEFTVSGQQLIGYGGSQSIEAPAHYSDVAKGLLKALGIEPQRFYQYYDQDFTHHHGLGSFWYFDKAHFSQNQLVPNPLGAAWVGADVPDNIAAVVSAMPLPEQSQQAFLALLAHTEDPLAGLSVDDKLRYLRGKSYEQYLRDDLGIPSDVIALFNRLPYGIWGVGYEALSALQATRSGMPGTAGLGLMTVLYPDDTADEPYIFHFPEGNAGIARLLVRSLIPRCASGATMEDMVTATMDYSVLDDIAQSTRIRLNATVLNVAHGLDDDEDPMGSSMALASPMGASHVNVTYAQGDQLYRVQGKQVVMAGYNHMIRYLCPELPPAQAEALDWPEKVPLVYCNVALRNWHAFKAAGLYHFEAMRDFWVYGCLDFPVSMPGYAFSKDPSEPIVLHMVHIPTAKGLPPRAQFRAGRASLLGLSYDDYEARLREQLSGILGPHGFDFDRDVAAVTVNRWPHGYAYEYNDLYDPADWGPDKGPHVAARQPFGRITIANSDSHAYAYVNAAIDAAWRAVGELGLS